MSLATAGKDFCAGTGYSSPEQAIAAGAKTILDWCEFLAKIPKNSPARPIEQSPIKIANTRSLESWYRKTILECIAKHCEKKSVRYALICSRKGCWCRCAFCGVVFAQMQRYTASQTWRQQMRNLEHTEQCAVVQWANMNLKKYPELGLLFAIPNGGQRNKITAANLKKEGVKAGVPDLCLPVARAGWHGLYIELKAGKNTATPEQLFWIGQLRKQGYVAVVERGWERARQTIEDYLEGRIAK
jgi:hypothetical protein